MSNRPDSNKPLDRDAQSAAPRPTESDSAYQKRIIDALYRVGNLMTEIVDLKQLLNMILIESKEVVGAEASSLLLYDEKADDLYFEVALGEKGEQVKVIRLKIGEGIAGACAKERRTLVVNDVARDKRHYKQADKLTQFKTRNILATPLVHKGKLIGVLEVLNKFDNQPFNESDVKVIEFFADHAAIAVENALLVEANVRAERLAALGQAVASISHYVKNILAGIQGSSKLIDHGLKAGNFDIVREVWPILQRSNAKIASLVQDMLAYSKEREPNLVRANLNALADEVYKTVVTSAAETGVVVEAHLAGDMPDSMFDAERIHDALLNLVSNAIDATREQTAGEVLIETSYDREGRSIAVTVRDNGPGIPEDVRAKIFEPFFSTKGSKGTGLGLAVAQKVVREHGGDISVRSQPGRGAALTIWLPYIEPEENEATGDIA